ncbi:MAG: hypothetical protein KME11_07980 [Timaviella obliquedivisa GSE-PSE-MK23-08B]|nr:hypothetical protein [Timaviella obliquedivisa GSE-PSE-MK23-08B]
MPNATLSVTDYKSSVGDRIVNVRHRTINVEGRTINVDAPIVIVGDRFLGSCVKIKPSETH